MKIEKTLKDLQSRLDYLDRVISYVDDKLNEMPEGNLKIKRQGNAVSYYCAKPAENDHNGYPLNDRNLIRSLAQKSYLRKIRRSAEQESNKIRRFLSGYPETFMENVYSGLSDDRKRLASPVALADQEYMQKWLEEPFVPKGFEDGDPVFVTLNDERVRSKSEQIIADRLKYYGIPYKYECPLQVGKILMHPDFTILRMSDRRQLYWEHCGAMDKKEYSDYAVDRFNKYSRAGIIPGKDLFATFETQMHPLVTQVADQFINAHFK